MAMWIAAYITLLRYFVPRAQQRSLANADARSVAVGRIVDSYTNILTVKLFARAKEERSAVREALFNWTQAFLHSFRLVTGVTAVLSLMNSSLLVATGALSVVCGRAESRRAGQAAAGLLRSSCASWRCPAGSCRRSRRLRECWRRAGACRRSRARIVSSTRPTPRSSRSCAARSVSSNVTFHYDRDDGVIDDLSFRHRARREGRHRGAEWRRQDDDRFASPAAARSRAGRILIDGEDIAHVTQDLFRRNIAVVTQDGRPFCAPLDPR